MLLSGRKFDLTGVMRWRQGRFIINEEVKSKYRDDVVDPYDPIYQFRIGMAEHGMLCPYSSTAIKSLVRKVGVLG